MSTTIKKPLSPLMQQHADIKAGLPAGALLGMRLGDFIEFFGDDARDAAKLLRITLTARCGVPMSGIPFHAVDCYVEKLCDAGRTVVIANEEKQSLRIICAPSE